MDAPPKDRAARNRLRHILLLLLVWWPARSVSAAPPNIVLILADDLGFSDTAPYGSEIHTPTVSRLAAEGVRFTNYHTAASCAPTRGMLLTGVDSHRNGVPNIPEAIPSSKARHTNYRGTLSHGVVTLATLLHEAGYHTYMTGKWHLGKTPDLLPSARGFERTITMADTGADNWEKKPYLPIYRKANWFGDSKEIDLPQDFYSSKFFIDKTIEFIESHRADGRPFFSYIPFQAVHIPVQAPQEFTDHYLGRYDQGWTVLRRERLARARVLGVVPPGSMLAPVSTTRKWSTQSPEQKRYASKKMAVYAGMVEAMDFHLGRLLRYLAQNDLYQNTVFIFVSDNGPEGSDIFGMPGAALFRLWLASNGYNTRYETLGTRGSFVNIGPSLASAAAAPLAYYKFFAHEGGMRVPLIIAGPGVAQPGRISKAFVYVTDLVPSILELAHVAAPDPETRRPRVEPLDGRSLLPVMRGVADRIHPETEATGYELGGNAALFRGRYKIVKDRPPVGDDTWHLFDIAQDPGEAHDLRGLHPLLFESLLDAYHGYVKEYGVLPVPKSYDQRRQVMFYGLRNRFGRSFALALAALGALAALAIGWRVSRRRR